MTADPRRYDSEVIRTVTDRLRVPERKQGLGMRDCVGTGDLFFAVLLTPLFDLREYLVLLLAGSVSSLTCWAAATRITGRPATYLYDGRQYDQRRTDRRQYHIQRPEFTIPDRWKFGQR